MKCFKNAHLNAKMFSNCHVTKFSMLRLVTCLSRNSLSYFISLSCFQGWRVRFESVCRECPIQLGMCVCVSLCEVMLTTPLDLGQTVWVKKLFCPQIGRVENVPHRPNVFSFSFFFGIFLLGLSSILSRGRF